MINNKLKFKFTLWAYITIIISILAYSLMFVIFLFFPEVAKFIFAVTTPITFYYISKVLEGYEHRVSTWERFLNLKKNGKGVHEYLLCQCDGSLCLSQVSAEYRKLIAD